MTRAFVEFDPPQPDPPDFEGDTADLVYFLSWGFAATRYGATHELSLAALALRDDCGIDIEPLLTFASTEIESPVDLMLLEDAWQHPLPLIECCEAVASALTSSDNAALVVAREGYPALAANIADLARIARWAHERRANLRVTYELTPAP